MDSEQTPDNPPPAGSNPSGPMDPNAGSRPVGQVQARTIIERLQAQYESLETLFALTVSALIVLSLGLNLFLFKQTRLARGQVHQQTPAIKRVVTEFHQVREPRIRSFIENLQDFSRTDPALATILEKYRPTLGKYLLPPGAATTSSTPASTNSP